MHDAEVVQEEQQEVQDRVSAAVRHALRLVGPTEGGAERLWSEAPPVSPPEEAV